MGAPSAQVQSPQSSQPASKGAGVSPSTPSGSGKGGQMSSMSDQPRMGQPNTNGNAGLPPINPNLQKLPMGEPNTNGGIGLQLDNTPPLVTTSDMSKISPNNSAINDAIAMGKPATMDEWQNRVKGITDQRNLNSGQTQIGPKPYSNFVAANDGVTPGNPYPNTIGNVGSVAGGPNGHPSGKGGGGNTARGGKA